jgi:hypothetical protein
MARRRAFNLLQFLGGLILAATATVPGLYLSDHPKTPILSIVCFLFVAAVGGLVAGALIAPSHRIAGAIGGMIAGPLSLLAVMFYLRGRASHYRAEVVIVGLVAYLPGLGVYFLLRLLTDAIAPPKKRRDRDFDDEDFEDDDFDDEDYDDRPRRRSRRRRDDDDYE